jgi:hypothetical protein
VSIFAIGDCGSVQRPKSLSEGSGRIQLGQRGRRGEGEAAALRAVRAAEGIGREPASRADPGLGSDLLGFVNGERR